MLNARIGIRMKAKKNLEAMRATSGLIRRWRMNGWRRAGSIGRMCEGGAGMYWTFIDDDPRNVKYFF